MDEDGEEHAVFAKTAYDYYLQGPDFVKKELQSYGFGEYHLDEAFSDDHAVTIVRPDGSAVIAYRGTHVSLDDAMSDYDLAADALILGGYHRNGVVRAGVDFMTRAFNQQTRFQRAEERYKDVKRTYPEVTLTGHSLGGQLASYVGRKHGEKAIMFNKGSSPLFDPVTFGRYEDHIHYTTGTDPISYAGTFSGEEVIDIDPEERHDYLTHSLHHFLPKKTKADIQLLERSDLRPSQGLLSSKESRQTFCDLYPDDELCRDS